MPIPHSNPYGYKNLLIYKKAEELQAECRKLTARFPRAKTMYDLSDQMDRSARSNKQNIVEGWKRNTTAEYHTFLGYSIAATAELEEDCKDIWGGVHRELKNTEGVMGRPGQRNLDMEKLRFYPLDKNLPPIVQLGLRCKEMIYLTRQTQESLAAKMEKEGTMPRAEKIKRAQRQQDNEDAILDRLLKESGLVRQENGKVVKKRDEGDEKGGRG